MLINAEESAKRMGITTRAFNKRVHAGHVIPADFKGERNSARFREEEIFALRKAIDEKFDIPTLAGSTAVSYALARSTAERVDRLYELLGVNHQRLSYEQDDVRALYESAQHTAGQDTSGMEGIRIYEWSKKLNAVDEPYLDLTRRITGEAHPWEAFLRLAQKMMEKAPTHKYVSDKKLASAYGFLDAARRNLRYISYFFVRTYESKDEADRLFPNAADDEILSLLQE